MNKRNMKDEKRKHNEYKLGEIEEKSQKKLDHFIR